MCLGPLPRSVLERRRGVAAHGPGILSSQFINFMPKLLEVTGLLSLSQDS